MSTEPEAPSLLVGLAAGWVAQLDARITELEPIIHEYEEAVEMRGRLTGEGFRTNRARAPRPAERVRAEHTGSRGRPRGSGKRSQEVLNLIATEPGLTVAQVAEKLSMQANYLYRVMPDLVKAGKLVKAGNAFSLAEDTDEAA